jgi:monoamine oxidase
MTFARRMFALHERSAASGIPVDELAGQAEETRRAKLHTRREVVVAGASAAAGVAFAVSPGASLAKKLAKPSSAPRIAIVGAGLAGLRCAHLLWTADPAQPHASTVYEANPERSGGRCWTLRDFFSNGLVTEHGGSFLNTDQTAVRGLAAELGLSEELVDGGDLPSGDEVFFIEGALYTLAEAQHDWSTLAYEVFKGALKESKSEAGEAKLDNMSVPEWLESTPIGAHSRFGKLMMANTVTENGGDPGEQSALDLIELIAFNKRSSVLPLPGDDERFHIVDGNDQLVSGMIAQLPDETVQHEHELIAVHENANRSIALTFAVGSATMQVTADFVVFALPFNTLRRVALARSGLSATKRKVIHTMGMGTNAKIHLELSHKTWPALGYSGATYGEWDRLACAWDDVVQLGPDASPALYLAFPGGKVGKTGISGEAHGAAPEVDASWALSQIEHVFPGTTAAYTGRAYEDHWALDPWVQGAYSYYKVGQASTYGRLARKPEGRFLFAGEHTSIANIGFLDGAVETGEHAARRLIRRLT